MRKSDSFDALRCLTKSTMPPLYLKVVLVTGSVRSSAKRISRPLFKKAMIWSRSRTVWARNSISSKIEASGQNVTVVPVRGSPVLRSLDAGPVAVTFFLTLPPFSNSASQCLLVAVDLEHQAGRQGVDDRDADTVQAARDLVALAAELAAGVQRGQHDLGRRLLGVLGVRSDRDPRPVVDDPDAAVGQQRDVDPGGRPAMASSTELSTTSQTRWCSPLGPVEPMYMPGRFRTGSSPSRMVMSASV